MKSQHFENGMDLVALNGPRGKVTFSMINEGQVQPQEALERRKVLGPPGQASSLVLLEN